MHLHWPILSLVLLSILFEVITYQSTLPPHVKNSSGFKMEDGKSLRKITKASGFFFSRNHLQNINFILQGTKKKKHPESNCYNLVHFGDRLKQLSDNQLNHFFSFLYKLSNPLLPLTNTSLSLFFHPLLPVPKFRILLHGK